MDIWIYGCADMREERAQTDDSNHLMIRQMIGFIDWNHKNCNKVQRRNKKTNIV